MGNTCLRNQNIEEGQQKKEEKQTNIKLTQSSLLGMLVQGLIANASNDRIKVCLRWNYYTIQNQQVAKKINGKGELGFKKNRIEAGIQAAGQHKTNQNIKKVSKQAIYILQPNSIEKISLKKNRLPNSTLSIWSLQQSQKNLMFSIPMNCIEDLSWIILNNKKPSKMKKAQYEFINKKLEEGYYDQRNICQHQSIINQNDVQGCLCCLKLKKLTKGNNKWFVCKDCQKSYCELCYNSKNNSMRVEISRISCLSPQYNIQQQKNDDDYFEETEVHQNDQ